MVRASGQNQFQIEGQFRLEVVRSRCNLARGSILKLLRLKEEELLATLLSFLIINS